MSKPELKVYTENLLEGAPHVPDCSVDLIFTSPPYKKKDGLSIELMEILGEVAGRVLRPGGRFFMNFGQLRPEGFDRPFEARDLVQEHSGLKATYHDRSVTEWVAFSHVLPGGDTHYFVSDEAMDRVHSLEGWRQELYEKKAA